LTFARTGILTLVTALLCLRPAVAGSGDTHHFSDEELIEWINTCNRQGGVCTLDWPFAPETGLIRPFGMEQMKNIAQSVSRGD
jgi:hypothetical protein